MSEIKKTSLFESIVSAIKITRAIFIIVVIEIVKYSWILLSFIIYTVNKIVPISTLYLTITNNIKLLLLSIKTKFVELLLYYPYCVYDCVNNYVTDIILFDKIETQRIKRTGKINKTTLFESITLFTIMITQIITIHVISIVKLIIIIIYLVLVAILITTMLIIDVIKFVMLVYMMLIPYIKYEYFVSLQYSIYWNCECVEYYVNNIILFNSNEIKYVNKFKPEKIKSLQHDKPKRVDYVEEHLLINTIMNNYSEVQHNNECNSEMFYDCENNHKCHVLSIDIKNLNKELQEYCMIKRMLLSSKEESDKIIVIHNKPNIKTEREKQMNVRNIVAMERVKKEQAMRKEFLKINRRIKLEQERSNREYESKMLSVEKQQNSIMKEIKSPTQDELNDIVAIHKYKQVYPDIKTGIKARYAKKCQKTFTSKIINDLKTITHNIAHYKTMRTLRNECIKQDLIIYNLNMKKNNIDHDKIQIENTQKKLQEFVKKNIVQQKKIINDIDKLLEQRNREFEENILKIDNYKLFEHRNREFEEKYYDTKTCE